MPSRWEWLLPDGRRVAATLEDDGREVVHLGERVASEGPRGAHAAGHVVEASPEIIVTFEPQVAVCVLRVDGHEIAPTTWPRSERSREASAPTQATRIPVGLVLALAMALVGTAAWGAWRALGAKGATSEVAASYRAPTGLFVAHHPSSFRTTVATAPNGGSAVLLTEAEREESVVIVATPLGDMPRDPWVVQKRLFREALAALPRADSAFDETGRSDETCIGEKGAVVVGRIATARAASAKVWSCAFVKGDAAFVVGYALPEGAPKANEAALRAIVEATDTTKLADVGSK